MNLKLCTSANIEEKNYRNLHNENKINPNFGYQNNTIGNTNQFLNTQTNPQNIYNRNDTNMANLNTLVHTNKDNKNELRNTYNAMAPVNFRGETDVQNSNVNKTKLSDGDKHNNNEIYRQHHMHEKKKKKCSILQKSFL